MTDNTLMAILGKGILLDTRKATIPDEKAVSPAAAQAVKTVLSHISSTAADGAVRTVTTYSDGTSRISVTGGDSVELGNRATATA